MLGKILSTESTEYDKLTRAQRSFFRRLLIEVRPDEVLFLADDDRTSAEEAKRTLQLFRDSSMEECVLVVIISLI